MSENNQPTANDGNYQVNLRKTPVRLTDEQYEQLARKVLPMSFETSYKPGLVSKLIERSLRFAQIIDDDGTKVQLFDDSSEPAIETDYARMLRECRNWYDQAAANGVVPRVNLSITDGEEFDTPMRDMATPSETIFLKFLAISPTPPAPADDTEGNTEPNGDSA